jgi:hypothetical protein
MVFSFRVASRSGTLKHTGNREGYRERNNRKPFITQIDAQRFSDLISRRKARLKRDRAFVL